MKILAILLIIILGKGYEINSQAIGWSTRYVYNGATPIEIAPDNTGNVYVLFNTGTGVKIVKYNTTGDSIWVRLVSNDQNAVDMKLDNLGNILIVGQMGSSLTLDDIVLYKFNSNGNLLWSASYNNPSNTEDWAASMDIDPSGNIIITGISKIGVVNKQMTLKFSASGTLLWSKIFNPFNSTDVISRDVKTDNLSNIYVTGYYSNIFSQSFTTLIKYNQNGDSIWVKHSLPGEPFKMGLDKNGNPVIAGFTSSGSIDYSIFKYSSTGSLLWSASYNSPTNSDDYTVSLALDTSGNAFITGRSEIDQFNTNTITVKYNSTGTFQWARIYDGQAALSWDDAWDMDVDLSGNVYVLARSPGISDLDYLTIKYNTNGDSLMVLRSVNGEDEDAQRIAVDNQGGIYVTGVCETFQYAKTIKYLQVPFSAPANLTATAVSSSKINLTWQENNTLEAGFKIQRSTNAGATWILKDSVGSNITSYTDSLLTQNTIYYFRIFAYNLYNNSSFSNVAYDTTFLFTSITQTGTEIPDVFKLYNNYPNPFNPVTKIKFDIPAVSGNSIPVKIAVYNLLGEEVSVLADKQMNPGSYEVNFDASMYSTGVYFYRIETGKFTDVKKMILIK